jgi:hypothetical protein
VILPSRCSWTTTEHPASVLRQRVFSIYARRGAVRQ